MKIPFEWEILKRDDTDNITTETCRAKVFGGWIVTEFWSSDDEKTVSQVAVFIPDPTHGWEV